MHQIEVLWSGDIQILRASISYMFGVIAAVMGVIVWQTWALRGRWEQSTKMSFITLSALALVMATSYYVAIQGDYSNVYRMNCLVLLVLAAVFVALVHLSVTLGMLRRGASNAE